MHYDVQEANKFMNASSILQLNPPIPVVTADGKGEAIGWIDYGKDDDLLWIVFLQKNGECWIYPNPQIRACPNVTLGRMPQVSTAALSKSIRSYSATQKESALKKREQVRELPSSKNYSQNGNGFHFKKRKNLRSQTIYEK
jgi:hypothetical protein